MIKVESTKVSEEVKGKVAKTAENLRQQGWSDREITSKIARKYHCTVSLSYRGEDTTFHLHPMSR